MYLQLLELLQNSSFVKKLLREAQKSYYLFIFFNFFFFFFIYLFFFSRTSEKAHGCRSTIVVWCGLQINVN